MNILDLCVDPPEPSADDWNDEGVVVLEGFMPSDLIGRYCTRWLIENSANHKPVRWGGWPDSTPYMRHDEIKDLLCYKPLADKLEELTGEPMGVHLNLTGWITTTRDWHQDQYLNEPGVGDMYAAVWIALDDIHPDSGPFQYVPGSHRWPQVDRARLFELLGDRAREPDWPRYSEVILTELFVDEINRRDADVITYVPKRGDVLIWHPRLLHRGSIAKDPGRERRAVIAHYSGITTRARIDMPNWRKHGGGFYYVLNGGPV